MLLLQKQQSALQHSFLRYWHNGCARIRQSAFLKAVKTIWGFLINAGQSNPKTVPSDEGKIMAEVRRSQRTYSSLVAVVPEDLICFTLARNSFVAGRMEHRQMRVLWNPSGSSPLWEVFWRLMVQGVLTFFCRAMNKERPLIYIAFMLWDAVAFNFYVFSFYFLFTIESWHSLWSDAVYKLLKNWHLGTKQQTTFFYF